jgi:hypothetical protein
MVTQLPVALRWFFLPLLLTAACTTTQPAVNNLPPATLDWPNHDCDPIHPAHCALPWPSNQYLVADSKTKTGYKLQFGATTLPKNSGGAGMAPPPYTQLDGYGVGTALLMQWHNLDVTGLPAENTPAGSVAADANIVLLEVVGGKVTRHVPYFVELDLTEKDASVQMCIVRPLVILNEATRYVVGVRGLKDTTGKAFTAAPAFDLLKASNTAGTAIADRQAKFDDIFALLDSEGVKKDELILAWDFVTASTEVEHTRLLHMRDEAQKTLGDRGPLLTVKEVRTFTAEQDADIAMEVTGTFHVPSYLRYDDDAGLHFLNLGADGMPVQNGWRDPEFFARIPRAALNGPAFGLMEYGHGLNGHAGEVESGYLGTLGTKTKLIPYACHMYGMSQFEAAEIFMVLNAMTNFNALPEKLHQGMLEYTLLQRAMREQFGELPAVKAAGVTVDKTRMHYYGNSQGGIYGGVVLALSTDVTRGAIGVVGNNYATLLQRSKDFEMFFGIIRGIYPDTRDQIILLSAIQLLWDSVDPVTHYAHLTAKPHANTPAHAVLGDVAVGDHQVAPLTMEIAARTNGDLKLMANWGRDLFQVTPQAYPYTGSAVVSWKCGIEWAVPGNLPNGVGKDPHECPRRSKAHMAQMAHFFDTGEIVDECNGAPCLVPDSEW